MKANIPLRYQEEVPAPFWLQTVILVGIGALIAAIVAAAAGDDTGWPLYVYYPFMAFLAAALLLVLLSFRRLKIAVSDQDLHFAFGVFKKSFPLASIQRAEAKKYRWLTYGGWGIRYALGGRRAWSLPGTPEGVEITVSEGKRVRTYFVSSRSPALLAEALTAR
jgi:Protein of unknown function (DUF3093)